MSSSMIHPTTRRLDGPKTNHNSRSNQAAMDAIFPTGPAVNGYETPQVQELGNQLLLGKDVTGDQLSDWKQALNLWGFPSDTTLDYAANGAPAYDEVEVGGGGLPASAWVPNPMSPGDPELSPANQVAAPEGYGAADKMKVNWGNGPGVVNMSPDVSSKKIKEGLTLGQTFGIVNGNGTRSWSDNTAG